MFVCRGHGEKNETSKKSDVQNITQIEPATLQFSAFVENMSFLYLEAFVGSGSFEAFDSFCRSQGYTCSAISISDRNNCRMFGRKLLVCNNGKDVIVYHKTRGTYIGSRFTKKCKIQEHYGFFKHNGKKMFNDDCLTNEKLLKYLDEEVVQGVCPFLLKAKVYNSVHGLRSTKKKKATLDMGLIEAAARVKRKGKYGVIIL